jgi:hypothetical protein
VTKLGRPSLVSCAASPTRGKTRNRQYTSDVFQLGFIHPEVRSQFMEHRLPDRVTDLGFIGADRLDVFLVQDDAVGPIGRSKRMRQTKRTVDVCGGV